MTDKQLRNPCSFLSGGGNKRADAFAPTDSSWLPLSSVPYFIWMTPPADSKKTFAMSKAAASALCAILLVMGAALVIEHQARIKLRQEMLAFKLEIQQLTDQVASLQQNHPPATVPTGDAPSPDPQTDESLLRAELNQLLERLAQLEHANAGLSNQIAAASGANDPFVYPDAKRKKDYTFSGYAAPQSALQTLLWAITQSDPKTFQASLAGEMAGAFATQFQDLPEGVMPGGFKNGAMYQASGYRVLEETPISNEETRLKVFLEGKPKIAIKVVFKKVGGEWKWARSE